LSFYAGADATLNTALTIGPISAVANGFAVFNSSQGNPWAGVFFVFNNTNQNYSIRLDDNGNTTDMLYASNCSSLQARRFYGLFLRTAVA
jgi:hypothetical protein